MASRQQLFLSRGSQPFQGFLNGVVTAIDQDGEAILLGGSGRHIIEDDPLHFVPCHRLLGCRTPLLQREGYRLDTLYRPQTRETCFNQRDLGGCQQTAELDLEHTTGSLIIHRDKHRADCTESSIDRALNRILLSIVIGQHLNRCRLIAAAVAPHDRQGEAAARLCCGIAQVDTLDIVELTGGITGLQFVDCNARSGNDGDAREIIHIQRLNAQHTPGQPTGHRARVPGGHLNQTGGDGLRGNRFCLRRRLATRGSGYRIRHSQGLQRFTRQFALESDLKAALAGTTIHRADHDIADRNVKHPGNRRLQRQSGFTIGQRLEVFDLDPRANASGHIDRQGLRNSIGIAKIGGGNTEGLHGVEHQLGHILTRKTPGELDRPALRFTTDLNTPTTDFRQRFEDGLQLLRRGIGAKRRGQTAVRAELHAILTTGSTQADLLRLAARKRLLHRAQGHRRCDGIRQAGDLDQSNRLTRQTAAKRDLPGTGCRRGHPEVDIRDGRTDGLQELCTHERGAAIR